MIAAQTTYSFPAPRFPIGRLLVVIGVAVALAVGLVLLITSDTNPRFDPQAGNVTRAANGTEISLTWQASHDGYCQIKGELNLPDGRKENLTRRVFAPCRGEDVRETWEKFAQKIFERFGLKELELLKDQVIPLIDKIRHALSVIGI